MTPSFIVVVVVGEANDRETYYTENIGAMPNVDHHPCLRGAEELAAAKKSKAIYLYKVGSPQNESVLSEMAKKSL